MTENEARAPQARVLEAQALDDRALDADARQGRAFADLALDRRRFLIAAAAAAAGGTGMAGGARAQTSGDPAATAPEGAPFGLEDVMSRARALAASPYQAQSQDLRGVFADLGYDQYRAIRYKPERRLWQGEERGFVVDLLPPGSIYTDRVEISVVDDGIAHPVPLDPTALHFDPALHDVPEDGNVPAEAGEGMTWTGFRLRFPVNRPEAQDEIAVFQGASYFRGVGRNQIFGLSARALAIRTGAPAGEEFPVFRQFWLVRPQRNAAELRLFALLDSPSLTGAYEFLIRPGAETTMDISSTLYPRQDVAELGVAPMTSMYYFGPKDRWEVDDYRVAVHDSGGLQLLSGRGERIWRPLDNPGTLQLSSFLDENPEGFGLVQRARQFSDYEDAEARYEKRPSAWIKPLDHWEKGAVQLVEIPTDNEFNDNIVAFWRPQAGLKAGEPTRYDYRLYWCATPPDDAPTARVVSTRAGISIHDRAQEVIMVDFDLDGRSPEGLAPQAEARGATLADVVLFPLPGGGRLRAALRFAPPADGAVELRLLLVKADGGEPASETWLYRWTAP